MTRRDEGMTELGTASVSGSGDDMRSMSEFDAMVAVAIVLCSYSHRIRIRSWLATIGIILLAIWWVVDSDSD